MALKIKKTIKLPDGSEVQVEGTEEEVRNYESRVKGTVESKIEEGHKKPTLLGIAIEDLTKILEDAIVRAGQLHRCPARVYPSPWPRQFIPDPWKYPYWDTYITWSSSSVPSYSLSDDLLAKNSN